MKTFEIGKTYTMNSPCDHACTWIYKVIARTAATVTLLDDEGKKSVRRIDKRYSEYCGVEVVHPLGKFSMCPSLYAE